jgi:hypothetical protein
MKKYKFVTPIRNEYREMMNPNYALKVCQHRGCLQFIKFQNEAYNFLRVNLTAKILNELETKGLKDE